MTGAGAGGAGTGVAVGGRGVGDGGAVTVVGSCAVGIELGAARVGRGTAEVLVGIGAVRLGTAAAGTARGAVVGDGSEGEGVGGEGWERSSVDVVTAASDAALPVSPAFPSAASATCCIAWRTGSPIGVVATITATTKAPRPPAPAYASAAKRSRAARPRSAGRSSSLSGLHAAGSLRVTAVPQRGGESADEG